MPGYGDPPKEYQFTSERQPSLEKRKIPKYKSWAKKLFWKEIKVVEDKFKEGNDKIIVEVMNRAFGKVKDELDLNGNLNQVIKVTLPKDLNNPDGN
jgi:hypothetical protein